VFPSSLPVPAQNQRVDQYDREGRFIGRTGGVEGIDYGSGAQDNDLLGTQIAAFNRLVGSGGGSGGGGSSPFRPNEITVLAKDQTPAFTQWGSWERPDQMQTGFWEPPRPKPATGGK
jgi:hypothetical protein